MYKFCLYLLVVAIIIALISGETTSVKPPLQSKRGLVSYKYSNSNVHKTKSEGSFTINSDSNEKIPNVVPSGSSMINTDSSGNVPNVDFHGSSMVTSDSNEKMPSGSSVINTDSRGNDLGTKSDGSFMVHSDSNEKLPNVVSGGPSMINTDSRDNAPSMDFQGSSVGNLESNEKIPNVVSGGSSMIITDSSEFSNGRNNDRYRVPSNLNIPSTDNSADSWRSSSKSLDSSESPSNIGRPTLVDESSVNVPDSSANNYRQGPAYQSAGYQYYYRAGNIVTPGENGGQAADGPFTSQQFGRAPTYVSPGMQGSRVSVTYGSRRRRYI